MALNVPDATPDRGESVAILSIVLLILITISTAIRVLSKPLTRQRWWWDDFFAVMTFLFGIAFLVLAPISHSNGLGYHGTTVYSISPARLTKSGQYSYIASFLFAGSVAFSKLAAIAFYARVFNVAHNRHIRIHLWILASVTSTWMLAAWISLLLQCRPIQRSWDATVPGSCADAYKTSLAHAIISSIMDLFILLLPLPLIWALKVPLRQRIYLLFAFCLAYSVIVLSLGRVVAVVRVISVLSYDDHADFTWTMPLYLYWAVLELSASIFCVNVPAGIAVVKYFVELRRASSSLSESGELESKEGKSSSPSRRSSHFGSSSSRQTLRTISAGGGGVVPGLDKLPDSTARLVVEGERPSLGRGEIRIQTDIELTTC